MRTQNIMKICFVTAFVFLIMITGIVAAETNSSASESTGSVSIGGGVGVYNGTNLYDIVGLDNSDFVEMNASNFAGFVLEETLRIYGGDFVSERTINEYGLVYETRIEQVEYKSIAWENETYPLIAFFRDTYVPTDIYDAGELVRLLVDSNDIYTLKINDVLQLPNGYELTAKQIDVDGNKVWLELSRDGVLVDDEIVDITAGDATWNYDANVGDQNDVIVFRALITDISQVDKHIVIKGLWLVDFQNVLEINSGEEFGILEVDSVSNSLSLMNYEPISLIPDSIQKIAGEMAFNVNSSIEHLEFYLTIESTEPIIIDDNMKGDFDGDEDIDFDDFVEFAAAYNRVEGDSGYDDIFDFDEDNDVDFDDFVEFAGVYGTKTYTIYLENFLAQPSNLTIDRNDNVVWLNKNYPERVFTLISNEELWENTNIGEGLTYRYKFNETGTYTYKMLGWEERMKGTIVVK